VRFFTAGESHGRGIIGLIESFPAGYEISAAEIDRQLVRRQQGYGRGQRMKIEKDRVRILSGMRQGLTLGSPIACLIENRDWPNWRKIMDPHSPIPDKLTAREKRRAFEVTAPRPGHADLAGGIKYHTHDLRNILERASARETAARVACGAVARQFLEAYHIFIASHVISIGKVKARAGKTVFEEIANRADHSPVRCIDQRASEKMKEEIRKAIQQKDSLGGVFEVRVAGLPVGLGANSQWLDRLDAMLAAAMMSIPSVKGVEIGDGFAGSRRPGSRAHDRIEYKAEKGSEKSKRYVRRTNHAGGIEGGITNGAELIVRAACKPISSLRRPQPTVDVVSKKAARAMAERADTCVVPAAAVVGEAMAAMILSRAFVDKFGHDCKTDIDANFEAYLSREY